LNGRNGFFGAGLALKSHQEMIITVKADSQFTLQLEETGGERVFLMANLGGESSAVKLEYIDGTHSLTVTAPRKSRKTLEIFWGPEQYGSYEHLLDYAVAVDK